MPRIDYAVDDRSVEARTDETILEASLRSGIPHAHACGGQAKCSTCRVAILEGLEHCSNRNDRELVLAERLHFSDEIRLACQTTISGNVRLRRLVMDDEDVQLTDQTSAGNNLTSVGEEKVLAVMFADIRGFTSFAEDLPPYDVVHVLNRFFRHMGRAISQNGGSIQNYMGDGLMALFGLDDGGLEALHAAKAGLAMLDEMERFKPYLLTNCDKSFDVRIGVHWGPAVVGPVGSEKVRLVTAIGDTVNLASRIESANKLSSTRFLISQETYHRVRDQVLIGGTFEFSLPGKSGTYHLYEPIGLKE